MIPVNELRIGNWVNKITGGVIDARKYENVQVTVELLDYDSLLYPIPLTSEILEKCGFVKCENLDGDELYIIDYFRLEYMEFSTISKDGFYFNWDAPNETYVKYLHQLQNLYFALTGQELEVKL